MPAKVRYQCCNSCCGCCPGRTLPGMVLATVQVCACANLSNLPLSLQIPDESPVAIPNQLCNAWQSSGSGPFNTVPTGCNGTYVSPTTGITHAYKTYLSITALCVNDPKIKNCSQYQIGVSTLVTIDGQPPPFIPGPDPFFRGAGFSFGGGPTTIPPHSPDSCSCQPLRLEWDNLQSGVETSGIGSYYLDVCTGNITFDPNTLSYTGTVVVQE